MNPIAIVAISEAAGRWNAASPGSDREGRLRAAAAISGIRDSTNRAQQIQTPAAMTTAASWPLSRRRRSNETWCRDGVVCGTMWTAAMSTGTPTTIAISTNSAPTPRVNRPSRWPTVGLVGVLIELPVRS